MMTASEMRKIAHKNGSFDEEVKKCISSLERNIRNVAERGETSTYLCNVYKYANYSDLYNAVIAHFEKDGFTFRIEQRVIGGDLQYPAYYVHW
jgi:hypothetical protein